MQRENCRVCGTSSTYIFQGEVINYPVAYYECPTCKYVQTERPYWLSEAYASAINDSDTGMLRRNIQNVPKVIATLAAIKSGPSNLVDYASGYGVLVRLLRDHGIDARWNDPYCENIFAKGFEFDTSTHDRVDLVTAFESFEHFVEPIVEAESMAKIGKNILFSTELMREPTPKLPEWWYYGKEHGQHIGFFRVPTLQWIANHLGLYLNTDGKSLHLMTSAPLSAIKWLAFLRMRKAIATIDRRSRKSLLLSDHQKHTKAA
jgi:hypothetical protein